VLQSSVSGHSAPLRFHDCLQCWVAEFTAGDKVHGHKRVARSTIAFSVATWLIVENCERKVHPRGMRLDHTDDRSLGLMKDSMVQRPERRAIESHAHALVFTPATAT
jgi:hypothetical protein